MSEKKEFLDHLRENHPGIDASKIIEILERKLSTIQVGPLDPNQDLRLPLGCDINKGIIVSVIDEYINGPIEKEKMVFSERREDSELKDIWDIATELMRSGKYAELRKLIKSYDNDTETAGDMKMVLVATKSMKDAPEIKDAREELKETLERKIGHKLI